MIKSILIGFFTHPDHYLALLSYSEELFTIVPFVRPIPMVLERLCSTGYQGLYQPLDYHEELRSNLWRRLLNFTAWEPNPIQQIVRLYLAAMTERSQTKSSEITLTCQRVPQGTRRPDGVSKELPNESFPVSIVNTTFGLFISLLD